MSKPQPPRVYLDTCLFFNVVKREEGLWGEPMKVLLAAERGDVELVSSTLMLAEAQGWKGDVDPELQQDTVNQYLGQDLVRWAELDLPTCDDARKLAHTYQLRGADAAHLATAIRLHADYFMSRDGKFPYGTRVGGVAVTLPVVVWQLSLDDERVDGEVRQETEADPSERVAEANP